MNIKEFYEINESQIIEDIIEFVNIPSIYDESTIAEDKPFGENVNRGLEWLLDKAKNMGMAVKNFDGYAGEITAGNGPKMIGILAHEDVVEAGEGWNSNPFHCHVKDGKLFGRGTADDKGPLISNLYVMKYLKDYNLIPEGCAVRMIIGTNEEEEWKGIDYYTSHVKDLPKYSIVPDGYFPLVYCEKGVIDFNMTYVAEKDELAEVEILELSGGVGRNIVPGKATCLLKCDSEETLEFILNRFSSDAVKIIRIKDSELKIEVTGKSTHAMAPENGLNAISVLMDILGSLEKKLSLSQFVKSYNTYIGMDFNGGKFGCNFQDEVSGKTTLNIGTIRYDGTKILMECNLRYPASMGKEDVKKAMLKTMDEAKFQYGNEIHLKPIYIEPDAPFIKALMASYQKITKDVETKPFSIGGATYARAIPGAVSFGPLFPYETELAHEPNEFLLLESLKKMTEIFADGIVSLLTMIS